MIKENKITDISLKKGDVLAEILVLDKLGKLTTTDIAKSRNIVRVIKVSDDNSFGTKKHNANVGDYILIPKFHQISDKIFKTDSNREFIVVNDQDFTLTLKNTK